MSNPAKHVDVFIGKTGTHASWQNEWSETTKCVYCGEEAEFIMAVIESRGGDASICHIHNNEPPRLVPDGAGYWPHDSVAVANYLCRKCFKVTSEINQA